MGVRVGGGGWPGGGGEGGGLGLGLGWGVNGRGVQSWRGPQRQGSRRTKRRCLQDSGWVAVDSNGAACFCGQTHLPPCHRRLTRSGLNMATSVTTACPMMSDALPRRPATVRNAQSRSVCGRAEGLCWTGRVQSKSEQREADTDGSFGGARQVNEEARAARAKRCRCFGQRACGRSPGLP
jgi:hypothetical protein